MKKNLLTKLLVVWLFCTLLVRVADAQWVVYTADVLPTAFSPAFTAASSAGSPVNEIIDDPAILGNKLLHMSTTDNLLWRQNFATASLGAATVVVRAKGLGGSATMVFEIDLDFGTKRQRVMIMSNGNWRGDAAAFGSGSLGVDVLDWNIYRFTKTGDQVALYVNENTEPVFTKTTGSGTSNYFRIGDGFGSNTMDAQFDWLLWNETGAYSPSQEGLPNGLTGVGTPPLSTAAEITVFKLTGQLENEIINSESGTIDIQVPTGTPLTAVVPELVTLSANATISPLADVPQNFSTEVIYTVTAQDGETSKQWSVQVTEVASSEKEITAFKLTENQIGNSLINTTNATVTVVVPLTTDVSDVVPVLFTVSPQATVNPAVSSAQNFSSPVEYEITAQDNSVKTWTVIVNKIDPDEVYITYEAEHAEFTGKIDSQHAGFSGSGFIDFLATGENQIIFTVCQQEAGARTAAFRYSLGKDEDRKGDLYVNDVFVKTLQFLPTATFTEWVEETAIVNLTAGINNIKITWDETDGPNLDKLSLGGAPCASYSLTVSATNEGTVSVSPERANHLYFEGEIVTLLAENKPDRTFSHWSGDLAGTDNPAQVVMNATKSITANFTIVNTYSLTVNTNGIGEVVLDPPGGLYAEGTTVTLTANSALGSTFQGWSGALTGNASPESITMNANKTVTASFTSDISIDFEVPVGFASVNTGSTYPNFNGPVTGGQHAEDTLWVNGSADFDMLAWHLYYRNRAYKNNTIENGVPKAPLVIVFKEGVYDEGTSASSAWGNHMMTIQEQGDLTLIGQGNVVIKFGFNIKRSWNILIRNLSFQDYYDDGINIGEPETHHIWVDHCTIGHPTTMPANTEHPDGGIDIKNGASYVTISWCNYRNSWKTGLVGHSDSNGSEDSGKLKVTYFGNYFYNTNSRNPRVRFGEVHVLNNLEEQVMLYGIAASNLSQVYAENNFFLNTRWPMYADRAVADFRAVYGNNTDNTFTSKTGNRVATGLKAVGNAYDDSGLPVITAQINPAMLNPGGRSIAFDQLNPEQVFNPSSYYSYTAFPASAVRTIVPLFAGAGKVNFFQAEAGDEDGVISITGALTQFTQMLGQPSEVQTYSVSATELSGNLIITPPAGYEVSADAGVNWFTNESPLVLSQTDGVVSLTTISVQLNATAAGDYAGNISHTASGAGVVLLAVSGTAQTSGGGIPEGNWTIYEANQLPNAFNPAFVTSQQSGTFSNTILADPDKEGNNVLRMETEAIANNNQWRQNVTAGLQDITVVIKAKSIDADKNLLFDIDMDHGTNRWSMRVLNNGEFSIAFGSSSESISLGGINILEWNTFRFAKSGSTVAVYVNESTTPVYTGTANAGTQNYFRFGDGWGSGNLSSDIDWVIWDVTGAYSPEETSLPANLIDDEDPAEPVAAITTTGTLAAFTQITGTPSAVQSYHVSGNHLTAAITVTPPTDFELSLDGVTWNTSAITLTPVSQVVASTEIKVRLNAASTGNHSGNIAHTSAGVTPVNVPVSGSTQDPVQTPVITVNGLLNAFNQIAGTPSAVQTYSVSGANLTANITVTPPQHTELSADGGTSWKSAANPLVLSQSGGNVAQTTISVRLNASEAATVNGNISHTSTGADTKTVSVSGTSAVVTSIDPELKSGVKAYPNPVKGMLTIEHPVTPYQAFIVMYNQLGMKVRAIVVLPGDTKTSIDIAAFSNGIYFAEYMNGAGSVKLKFIKID